MTAPIDRFNLANRFAVGPKTTRFAGKPSSPTVMPAVADAFVRANTVRFGADAKQPETKSFTEQLAARRVEGDPATDYTLDQYYSRTDHTGVPIGQQISAPPGAKDGKGNPIQNVGSYYIRLDYLSNPDLQDQYMLPQIRETGRTGGGKGVESLMKVAEGAARFDDRGVLLEAGRALYQMAKRGIKPANVALDILKAPLDKALTKANKEGLYLGSKMAYEFDDGQAYYEDKRALLLATGELGTAKHLPQVLEDIKTHSVKYSPSAEYALFTMANRGIPEALKAFNDLTIYYLKRTEASAKAEDDGWPFSADDKYKCLRMIKEEGRTDAFLPYLTEFARLGNAELKKAAEDTIMKLASRGYAHQDETTDAILKQRIELAPDADAKIAAVRLVGDTASAGMVPYLEQIIAQPGKAEVSDAQRRLQDFMIKKAALDLFTAAGYDEPAIFQGTLNALAEGRRVDYNPAQVTADAAVGNHEAFEKLAAQVLGLQIDKTEELVFHAVDSIIGMANRGLKPALDVVVDKLINYQDPPEAKTRFGPMIRSLALRSLIDEELWGKLTENNYEEKLGQALNKFDFDAWQDNSQDEKLFLEGANRKLFLESIPEPGTLAGKMRNLLEQRITLSQPDTPPSSTFFKELTYATFGSEKGRLKLISRFNDFEALRPAIDDKYALMQVFLDPFIMDQIKTEKESSTALRAEVAKAKPKGEGPFRGDDLRTLVYCNLIEARLDNQPLKAVFEKTLKDNLGAPAPGQENDALVRALEASNLIGNLFYNPNRLLLDQDHADYIRQANTEIKAADQTPEKLNGTFSRFNQLTPAAYGLGNEMTDKQLQELPLGNSPISVSSRLLDNNKSLHPYGQASILLRNTIREIAQRGTDQNLPTLAAVLKTKQSLPQYGTTPLDWFQFASDSGQNIDKETATQLSSRNMRPQNTQGELLPDTAILAAKAIAKLATQKDANDNHPNTESVKTVLDLLAYQPIFAEPKPVGFDVLKPLRQDLNRAETGEASLEDAMAILQNIADATPEYDPAKPADEQEGSVTGQIRAVARQALNAIDISVLPIPLAESVVTKMRDLTSLNPVKQSPEGRAQLSKLYNKIIMTRRLGPNKPKTAPAPEAKESPKTP